MFNRIMAFVISAGVLLTFISGVSFGLNAGQALAIIVYGIIVAGIMAAGIILLLNAMFGLTGGQLRAAIAQEQADADDMESRRRRSNWDIRWQNRFNAWRLLVQIAVVFLVVRYALPGIPVLFGSDLDTVTGFFLANPVGNFMMIHILGLVPLWFILPWIYLSGFYGPFLIKVIFFDATLISRGSEVFNVKLEDIIGQTHNIKRLTELVSEFRNWRTLGDFKIRPPRGILLVGPPGVGKSETLRYIAGHFYMAMVIVKSSISRQTFVGVSVIAMAITWWRARRHAARNGGEAIVQIDEIDQLGQKRSEMPTGALGRAISYFLSFVPMPGGNQDDSALIVLMTALDGISSGAPLWFRLFRGRFNMLMDALLVDELIIMAINKIFKKDLEPWRIGPWKSGSFDGLIVIGATNRPQVLDPALTRAGRLEFKLYYDYPLREDVEDLVRKILPISACAEDLRTGEGIAYVAALLEGNSHSDVARIAERAKSAELTKLSNQYSGEKIREEDLRVSIADIHRTYSDQMYGLVREVRKTNRLHMWQTAIHEAGHAIVTVATNKMLSGRTNAAPLMLVHVSAKRRGHSLGRIESKPLLPTDTHWQSEFEARMMISLASYATELLFWDETSSGTKGDLESATFAAIQAHSFFGWGPRMCTPKERVRFHAIGMQVLVANEASAKMIARESRLHYSPLVREKFGEDRWLDPSFSEEFVETSLANETARNTIAVILGQVLVRAYRTVYENQSVIESVAQKLEEAGWEMEGPAVQKFFDMLDLQPIWQDGPWPELELPDPFYAGPARGHADG